MRTSRFPLLVDYEADILAALINGPRLSKALGRCRQRRLRAIRRLESFRLVKVARVPPAAWKVTLTAQGFSVLYHLIAVEYEELDSPGWQSSAYELLRVFGADSYLGRRLVRRPGNIIGKGRRGRPRKPYPQ